MSQYMSCVNAFGVRLIHEPSGSFYKINYIACNQTKHNYFYYVLMQLIFCILAMMFYKRYNQLCLWSFYLNSLVLVLGSFTTNTQLQNLALVIYGVNYLSSVPTQPFMFYLNSNNCLNCSFNNKINIRQFMVKIFVFFSIYILLWL